MTSATALPYPPAAPEWGHPLVTPEGATIRVPSFAFANLRRLGVLQGNSNRLSSNIYEFLQPEFDCLAEGLRRLLGADLSGPSRVACTCRDCQRNAADLDHTSLPGRDLLKDDETDRIVRDVKKRRRFA